MSQSNIIEFLPYLIKGGVIFGANVFGVAARESLSAILVPDYKFTKAIPKMILSLFVVIISLPFLEQVAFLNKIFPVSIVVIAFCYLDVAKSLPNILIKMLSDLADKYVKK